MPALTFEFLLDKEAFGVLAELFPDEVSSRALLEDTGIPVTEFRPFGQVSARLYWRDVCRIVDHGRFANADLDRLIGEASRHYPGNGSLQSLIDTPAPPAELRVLCLSAGPSDQDHLRLGAEHRKILEATRHAAHPVAVQVHPATRSTDLIRLVLESKPDVLHFAGHGNRRGELLLEDDAGRTALVGLSPLAGLLKFLPRLRAVVLTSCFAGGFADLLDDVTDTVIGSPRALADDCALGFVSPFYQALSKGEDVRTAFAFAMAALDVLACPPHEFRIEPAS